MVNKRGEISTLVVLGVLSVIGVATLISSTSTNRRNAIATRAEYDGTSCNDNIGDTLNSSGSTSFTINCWGNLNRAYSYVLFWCPNKSAGATYCGDPRDLNSNQATVLDRGSGAVLPSTLSKSTDKTCGCVQWDVGVGGATAQDGIAGGAIMCSSNACSGGGTNPTNPPVQPTTPPEAPTNPPVQPTNPPQATVAPATPTNSPIQPTTPPGSQNTPTRTPTPTSIFNPTCAANQKKCTGYSGCYSLLENCPSVATPTSIFNPTCAANQKKCTGYSGCYSLLENCPTVPTQTIQTQQVTLAPTSNRAPSPIPTPTPNVFKTATDIIMKSCRGPEGEFKWTEGCLLYDAVDDAIDKMNIFN